MDTFDRHVLQYVLSWTPFGKPPEEDLFPKFGMNGRDLADRFVAIVGAFGTSSEELEPADRDLLERARCHPLVDRSATVRRGKPRRPPHVR